MPILPYTRMLLRLLATATALGALASYTKADYPIASHRYLADPTVLVHEGRVYLYCSNDDENAGHESYMMQSLVCISSDDLKNWTDHGKVFEVPQNATWAERSWAPAAIARNDQFYLYFGNGGSGIGVANSDSPTGPYNDALGELLISWSTPGAAGENMWLFDPYTFIDDDGQAYIYFGGNGESNVRIAKLNEDMTSLNGAATSITAPGFFEAAWMHKRDDLYYFSYSTNPSNGLRIDYMTSDNPVSGFEYRGVVAAQPPNNNNNNHAGEFEFQNNWYHVYHNRFVANESGDPPGYLRNLGIEPLFYNEDGSIQEVAYTRDTLVQVRNLDPYQRVEGETFAAQSGVETEICDEGGMNLSELANGDWVQIRGVDFRLGADSFSARVASESTGTIEVRLDQQDGTLIGSCEISDTGGNNAWATVECAIDKAATVGVHDLYLSFVGESDSELFKLNWWQFQEAPLPPMPPEEVLIEAVSTTQLQISWNPSPSATHYTIWRARASEGPYSVLAESVVETAFIDSELENGVDYFYKVSASNEAGTGFDSTAAGATTAPNFDEWVATNFIDEPNPEVIGPEADPDRDGLSNLLEYYIGFDPQEADTSALTASLEEASNLIIRYKRSKNLAAVAATIQSSSDLVNWTDLELTWIEENVHSEYDTLKSLITPNGYEDPMFLRLAVRQKP